MNRGKRRKTDKRKASRFPQRKQSGTSTQKVFLTTLAILVAAGGGYLIYDKLRPKPQLIDNGSDQDIIINNNIPVVAAKASSNLSRSDSFPLKRGSRGTRVTQLQRAIADKIGIAAMNANGGIDGQFGPGTANALKIAGYGELIDEASFNKIVGGSSSGTAVTASSQAKDLYNAVRGRSIDSVVEQLRQLKTTSDYSAVNSYYKEIDFIGKTIVTDLLDYAFQGNEEAQSAIRNEFLRMGLKVNGSGVWSLQGIPLYRDMITMRDTFVIDAADNRIPVTKNTILGHELRIANGITWVKSIDQSILQVPTQDVKYT